jgi:hypothetical protein
MQGRDARKGCKGRDARKGCKEGMQGTAEVKARATELIQGITEGM